MKTISWPIKTFNTLLTKARGDFMAPGSRKVNKFYKFEKKLQVS